MYNNVPTKVLTGEVRLSYVNLVAPRANNSDPNATPKYSVTLLIPKTDVAGRRNGKAADPLFCPFPFTMAMAFVKTELPTDLSARVAG